ncbi:hypothetical protein CLIB1423_07S00694 [[Candida] railenensis]|uniref:Uncharacterized protein n=1 Tax=[Candida] railenensis TaxID=45579 RepID=A0A9P0QPG3_9ASCO|nr:hypothetical protein CLIB1423_07S00694 [[Candida] railenensis]
MSPLHLFHLFHTFHLFTHPRCIPLYIRNFTSEFHCAAPQPEPMKNQPSQSCEISEESVACLPPTERWKILIHTAYSAVCNLSTFLTISSDSQYTPIYPKLRFARLYVAPQFPFSFFFFFFT